MKFQKFAQQRIRSQFKIRRARASRLHFRSRRLGLESLESRLLLTGTWTPITTLPPLATEHNGTARFVLLSNGSVEVFGPPEELTPDATGSYVNGTWSPLPFATIPGPNRVDCAQEVLRDGRLMLLGGNPNINGQLVNNNTGLIYDPLSNAFTAMADFPEPTFGTGPTVLLNDGRVLAGSINGPQTYIYDPTTNSWSAGPTKLFGDSSQYESWTKLADGSILSYDVNSNPGEAQRLDPSTMTWIDSGTVPVPLEAGISPYPHMGPGVLLPDGRLFQLGRSSQTAIYIPSSEPGGAGTWTAGPTIPDGLEAGGGGDPPPSGGGGSVAAMMPNGHVLFVAEYPAIPDAFYNLFGPTRFYDFDPLANSLVDVSPVNAQLQARATNNTISLLVLPSGQVMMGYYNGGATGGNHIMFYTPDGGPQSAWKPTITSIAANGIHFTLTGTQLNGLSDGVDRSVSTEMNSNYPIIELKDTAGLVYFARTFNWSTTAAQTGSTPVTTDFTLPSFLPAGTYSLTVIANGISSDPVPFVVPVVGDFNFDSQLTGADVPAMMAALADLKTFKQAYGVSDATLLLIGDLNGDHVVNNADLQALLTKLRFTAPSNAPQMVLDINSTVAVGSSPDDLLTIGNTTYFTADDGIHGRELWKSDGTAAGTVMVKDINPGKDDSNPTYLTELNGQLYFSADDGTDGTELWKSDGTEAGTVMVKDLYPGTYYDQKSQAFRAYSSDPGPFTKFNGELYFPADDGDHGFELWKTDGTKDGTVLVKDIAPGAFDGLPYYGLLSALTPVGSTLFFVADDGDHGLELWKTDGTEAGTVMVKDIVPGSGYSLPYNLTNVNGTLFFDAYQTDSGDDELFKSDGTAAGTVLVADINPGPDGSYLYDPTAVNGILYFVANDGTHGNELWRSDGTTAGTQLVKDILPGSGTSKPANLINLNGTLYFSASDGVSGSELWKTDGTPGGTTLVKDINPGAGDSNIKNLVNVNGTLYFSANDGTHGNELWKSDGTAAGTVLVEDLNQRSVDSNPGNFTVLGNSLLFTADDGFHGTELWKLLISSGGGSSTSTALPGIATFGAATASSDTSGENEAAISAQTGISPAHRRWDQRVGQALSERVHHVARIAAADAEMAHASIVDESNTAGVIGTSLVTKPSASRLSVDPRIPIDGLIVTNQDTQSRLPHRYPMTSPRTFEVGRTPVSLPTTVVDQVITAPVDRERHTYKANRESLEFETIDSLFALDPDSCTLNP